MKTLHFTFSTGLAFSGPVTGHQLALRCLPMQDAVLDKTAPTPAAAVMVQALEGLFPGM